jgi:hypothetical protein
MQSRSGGIARNTIVNGGGLFVLAGGDDRRDRRVAARIPDVGSVTVMTALGLSALLTLA